MPKPRKRKLPSTTSLVAVSSDLEPEQGELRLPQQVAPGTPKLIPPFCSSTLSQEAHQGQEKAGGECLTRMRKRQTDPSCWAQTEKASFGTLPLDVVCEIARADFEAAWLLSRLNKTCWRLLTSKKMEKLWDNARANSDLPVVAKFATGAGSKKTKKMRPSLLQVAQLLFGLHCMVSPPFRLVRRRFRPRRARSDPRAVSQICGSSRSVHQVIHWGLYTRACSPCAKKQ